MNMTDGSSSLDVEVVVRRFTEAADLLDQIGERLKAVTIHEETAAEAAGAIQGSAGALKGIADQLAPLTDELGTAVRTTIETLEAATRFLASTDLSTLEARLDGMQDLLETRIADNRTEITGALESTKAELRQLAEMEERAREAEARVQEAELELTKLKSALPDRLRRKLGITL